MIYGHFFERNYDNEKCIIDDKTDVVQNIQAIMRQLITRFGGATQTHKNDKEPLNNPTNNER